MRVARCVDMGSVSPSGRPLASENLDNPKRARWSGVEWSGVAGIDHLGCMCVHDLLCIGRPWGRPGRVGVGTQLAGRRLGRGRGWCLESMWVVDALASAVLTGRAGSPGHAVMGQLGQVPSSGHAAAMYVRTVCDALTCCVRHEDGDGQTVKIQRVNIRLGVVDVMRCDAMPHDAAYM